MRSSVPFLAIGVDLVSYCACIDLSLCNILVKEMSIECDLNGRNCEADLYYAHYTLDFSLTFLTFYFRLETALGDFNRDRQTNIEKNKFGDIFRQARTQTDNRKGHRQTDRQRYPTPTTIEVLQ